MIGGLNAATWGRTIHITLVADRSGTAVSAQWTTRYTLQLITWEQENWHRVSFTKDGVGSQLTVLG